MSQQADISLHSQPTIIAVEDCYLPQKSDSVVELVKQWEIEGSEVFTIVFDTWGRMARLEMSGN